MNLNNKIKNVESIIKDKKVAIAFSGGADSTLISYLASKVSKNPIAITINNNLMPDDFIENAKKIAKTFKIKHIIVDKDFYNLEDFRKNKKNRCYICRDYMYSQIIKIAKNHDCEFIVDGTNISDLVENRPGILINYKNKIISPFVEAKVFSYEIHKYLKKNKIYYSKSTTCLATRIKNNEKITKEKINRIQKSENFIYDNTKCEIVKVRDFNNIALCEVDNINEFLKNNRFKQIHDELKTIGFEKVVLNLNEISGKTKIKLNKDNSYDLPYNISIENTKKEISEKTKEKNNSLILNNNIIINSNGKIELKNIKSKKEGVDKLISILPYIRRNL